MTYQDNFNRHINIHGRHFAFILFDYSGKGPDNDYEDIGWKNVENDWPRHYSVCILWNTPSLLSGYSKSKNDLKLHLGFRQTGQSSEVVPVYPAKQGCFMWRGSRGQRHKEQFAVPMVFSSTICILFEWADLRKGWGKCMLLYKNL